MEGLLILAVLAVACYGGLWFSARRTRRKLEQALSRAEQRANVVQAKLRAAEGHAETVRTVTLGWDQPAEDGARPGCPDLPPRVGIVPVPDRLALPLPEPEPMRTAEQILADFPPPPAIPSWREQLAEVQVEAAPSPLYAETLAAIPVVQPEAELEAVGYDEPAQVELSDPYNVEPDASEDEPKNEERVTERGRDDTDPPADSLPSPPDDTSARAPVGEVLAPIATTGVMPRYSWPRHAGPLGPWRPSDKLRTWVVFLGRRAVTRLTRPPRVRITRLAGMWAGGQLTMLMGGVPSPVHAIVRHRRRRGTWEMA